MSVVVKPYEVWYKERQKEARECMRIWGERVTEYKNALLDAKTDLAMCKALREGILYTIKAGISGKDYSTSGAELLKTARLGWGKALTDLNAEIEETELYIRECTEERENAERELNRARGELRGLINEETESRSLLTDFEEE